MLNACPFISQSLTYKSPNTTNQKKKMLYQSQCFGFVDNVNQ